MPASSILLLDADPAAAQSISPILTGGRLHGHPDGGRERGLQQGRGPPARHHRRRRRLEAGRRAVRRDPGDARPWPASRSCASARPTTSTSGSGSWSRAPTTSWPGPFDARELEARVEALLLRFQRSRGMTPIFSADGLTVARARRVVAVYSPKGGVGTTTIATNIAVAAALRRPDRVVLVDMSLQFGGVASHLNLPARADARRRRPRRDRDARVRDHEDLRDAALVGLHVIAAPGSPEGAASS